MARKDKSTSNRTTDTQPIGSGTKSASKHVTPSGTERTPSGETRQPVPGTTGQQIRGARQLIADAKQRRGGVPAWQPPTAALADLDEVVRYNAQCPAAERVSSEKIRTWLESDHGVRVSRECVRTYLTRRAKVLGV